MGCNLVDVACVTFLEKEVTVTEKEFDFQLRVEFSHLVVDSLLLNATYPLQERSILKVAERYLLFGAYILFI